MVASTLWTHYWEGAILAETVLERLDPQRRAAVVLALIGLCLLGVTMVVLTMLGARWVRGQRLRPARERHKSSPVDSPKRRVTVDRSNSTSETLSGPPTGEETSVDS